MRKDCDSCKHDEFGEKYCDDCYYGKNGNPPTKWEAADYYKPDTNVELIRRMTDEELADWLCDIIDCAKCPTVKHLTCGGMLEWLHQPIEE